MTAAGQLSGCTAPEPLSQVVPPGASYTPVPAPPIQKAPEIPVEAAPAPVLPPQEAVTAGHAKIALLVPLTGPNKTIGQAMLDAANMALFDVSADVALMPKDTGGTPEDARAAAEKAVADGAALILGPVFSAAVPPVREAAEPAQLSVIAYSTDATVGGGNVFVMGFLPAGQVGRVIGFARSRGMTRLAALVPDNSYGVAVTAEIGAAGARLGLQSPRILTINRDPKSQIASLANDPPDMLLVALGGEQLQGLAPAIGEFAMAHPVQLLGTGLWDDANLGQTPALAGGWYAAPPPGNFAEFAQRFQKIYNYRPPRIATLAYDSVALAASVEKDAGGNPKPLSRDTLLQPNGFSGIDGGFRFLPNGLSERNLAVLAIGPNGPTVVDEAPSNFEKLGE